MKTINNIILCIAALCVTVSPWVKLQAQDIHLITVGELRLFMDEKAQNGIRQDCRNITNFFKEMVPEKNLKIHDMDGNKVTAKGVLDLIKSIECSEKDTLVFYYSGHAANDDLFGGQYFQLRNDENNADDPLKRTMVLEEMVKKGAHLNVIMTDCCNIFYPIEFSPDKNMPQPNTDGNFAPVIKQLFIAPSGIADITSSRVGQVSMVSKDGSGSIGTVAWIEIFRRYNKELAEGSRKNILWRETLVSCAQRTDGIFKQTFPNGVQGQKSQDMHIYELPEKPRIGVRGMTLEMDSGVKVTEVVVGAPGEQAGIKVDDLIIKINGKVIQDEVEYSKAVDAAADKMEVVIRRGDKEQTLTLFLEPGAQAAATGATTAATTGTSNSAKVNMVEIKTMGLSLSGNTVVQIDPEGSAAKGRIELGDKIISIDQKAITTPENCLQTLKDFEKNNNIDKKFVEVIIERKTDGKQRRTSVKIR